MSKTASDVALELTLAVIKAKAEVLANSSHEKNALIEKWLSDEAVSQTYKTIYENI